MITAIIVISYAAAVLALIDQIRRPASAWAAADRNRGWWIGMTVVLGLFACGVIIGACYLVGVVPRFASSAPVDDAFRKQR
jgi:hypothetical protein